MSHGCAKTSCEVDALQGRQTRTLRIVLGINIVMFAVEVVAGLLSGSTALLADSLDMLGDSLAYSLSLYVVGRNQTWKARAAFFKGGIMGVFGLFVLGRVIFKVLNPEMPHYETMGIIGVLALMANSTCLALLWRHQKEDINMRSVWLCSRNDIIANVSVLFAALGVWLTKSQWPDQLVGFGIATLFLLSAMHVIQDASRTYNRNHPAVRH